MKKHHKAKKEIEIPGAAQRGAQDSESIRVAKDISFSIAALAFAVSSYVFFCYFVVRNPHPIDQRALYQFAMQVQQLQWGEIHPEPNEQHFFLFGLFYLPLASMLVYYGLRRFDEHNPRWFHFASSIPFTVLRDVLAATVVVVWLGYIVHSARTDIGMGHLYLVFPTFLFWAAVVLFLPWSILRTRIHFALSSKLIVPAGIVILLAASLQMLIPEHWMFINSFLGHYSDEYATVNQVLHGKTALVDLKSQYGVLYPHVAEAVFRVFHYSLFNLSVYFAALVFTTYFFIFLVLHRMMGSRSWFAVVALIVILGINHSFYIVYTSRIQDVISNELIAFPYFSYLPVRTIWGTFMTYYVWRYVHNPNRLKLVFGYLCAGISVIWNADTGVIVLVAWLATQIFMIWSGLNNSPSKKVIASTGHLLAAIGALTAAVAGYSAFALIRTGMVPSWRDLLAVQNLYYHLGYGMRPMRPVDLWHLPVWIYLVGIFGCARAFVNKTVTPNSHFVFFLALYGAGIFSYYQGRSHFLCFFTITYPALMLAMIMIHDFWQNLDTKLVGMATLWRDADLRFRTIYIIPSAAVLVFGLLTYATMAPSAYHYLKNDIVMNWQADRTQAPPLPEAIDYIRQHKESNEIAIFGDWADYLYVKTGTYHPFAFSTLRNMTLTQDFVDVQALLNSGRVRQVFYLPSSTYQMFYKMTNFTYKSTMADGKPLIELHYRNADHLPRQDR